MPEDCTIPDGAVLPAELRCTGLYQDWPSLDLRCDVVEYAPAYPLWSDGAEKRRYVSLPPQTQVDVTDPDDFQYPVGTKFWKEFHVRDGDGSRLGETRFMRRVELGWMYTSYVWSEDGTEAIQQNEGVVDLHGTGHTVPTREQCKTCHSGRGDFILGWDALMLGPGATGLTRDELLRRDLITWAGKADGVPNPLQLEIPGDEIEKAALGYLHANCGISCHNATSSAEAEETGFFMRLDADSLQTVQSTPTYSTGYQRPYSPNATIAELPTPDAGTYVDLQPLDPDLSLLLVRMKVRGIEAAMPRIGTNLADDEGIAIVQAWIESMTPERGYVAPMD